MASTLRNSLAGAALAAGLVVSGCQSACTSAELAPAPTAADDARAEMTELPFTVAVERGDFPQVYADHLVQALRASGLFDEVTLRGEGDGHPDLIARVLSPSEGAAVIPFWTALTLGIFPTWAQETWGEQFSLAPPDGTATPVVIDFRWSGTTVLGWASAFLNLSPNRSGGDPTAGPRFAAHVAASIAPQADAIAALVHPPVALQR